MDVIPILFFGVVALAVLAFVVVVGFFVFFIVRAAGGSMGNRYRSGNYVAGSPTFMETTSLDMPDDGNDIDPTMVGTAIDMGYIQADAGAIYQQPVDTGVLNQQGADTGAFGSSGADMSAASNAGWDTGSALGSAIGSDLASSTFTGSMDSGMSGGGTDSGSSGM